MKLLFLDIDGVLNTTASISRGVRLLPDKAALVMSIVRATDALVVVSSSWRTVHNLAKLDALLSGVGGPRIHATTPILESGDHRGREIADYLAGSGVVESYVIIDDAIDILPSQFLFLIQTDAESGLLPRHAERAIAMLAG